MSLSETIYRLRSEKNLSQGELADALEVSRQSVSKWENNAAVPDLDKLIKMAGLFDVSLDELVGSSTKKQTTTSQPDSTSPSLPSNTAKSSGILPGFILLIIAAVLCMCITLRISLLSGILYTLPLFVCSALCFLLKRRRGLWCCWTLLFSIISVIYAGTGVGLQPFWSYISTTFPSPPQLYYFITALTINLSVIGMNFWTLRSYRQTARKKISLSLGWTLTFIPYILSGVLSSYAIRFSANSAQRTFILLRWLSYGMNWLHLGAVLVMLILTTSVFRFLQMHLKTK